jgi:hypothetical protein
MKLVARGQNYSVHFNYTLYNIQRVPNLSPKNVTQQFPMSILTRNCNQRFSYASVWFYRGLNYYKSGNMLQKRF